MNAKCWSCGESLESILLPISRREECSHCGSDIHVCKMCVYYSGSRSHCDEDRAEHISEHEKANFCDYFKLYEALEVDSNVNKQAKAKAELAALFGDEPEPKPDIEEQALTPAELAEKKLREMLGG